MKGQKVFRFNKRFYTYIIAAVMLLVVVSVFSLIIKGESRMSLYYSPSQNGATVLLDGENTGKIVPGNGISSVRYNRDATSCAVLMSDGTAYSLYTVKNKKIEKVADNCTNNFVYSFNGKNVVYLTADGYLYSGKKLIDESVEAFAVSPDCSAVIFSKKTENVKKLYLNIRGKTTFVNENYTPLAVSEDGEYLYVLSGDNSLCILNADGTMKSKLCSAVQSDSFLFSDDLKSIVFSDSEYTYISVEGKSRIRLIPGKATPALIGTQENRLDSSGTSFICDDTDLTGLFYSADNDNGTSALFYVDEDCNRIDIADAVKKYVVTGKDKMTYLDSMGKIYKYNGNTGELIVSGASDFEATENNKYIYYMTTAHELYSVKRSNIQLIANGADKMCMNSSDELFVIMTDKTLCSVSGVKRSDVIASDVVFCACEGNITYYATGFKSATGTFELYASVDSGKFRFVIDGVMKQ